MRHGARERAHAALPAITEALEIDGYTQSGAVENILAEGGLTTEIRIDLAAGTYTTEGLRIDASNVTIRGLAVRGYATNISISNTSTSVVIAGNFIGVAADGSTDGSTGYGIKCNLCAGVTIGGAS